MFSVWILVTAMLLPVDAPPPGAPTQENLRSALTKALPLLERGAQGHVELRSCFACHNQALPMLAGTAARAKGFPFSEEDVQFQTKYVAEFLDKNREEYLQGKGQGGQVDTAGYALFTLELGGWLPDKTTAAVVEYLLQRDKDLDRYRSLSNRPPSEASDFTTTYFAVRALRHWGTPEQMDRIEARRKGIRKGLLKHKPKDTEDRVFRLLTMAELNVDAAVRKEAAQELVEQQRPDGGWAQLDGMSSDAYATGTVLYAMHHAGGVAVRDEAFQRGLGFLVRTQLDDGSWFVASRSRPFQTYFESGFPHEKNQFISIAASGWAATALALGIDDQPASGQSR